MTTKTHSNKKKTIIFSLFVMIIIIYRITFLSPNILERFTAFITYPFIATASHCVQGIQALRNSFQSYRLLEQEHLQLKEKYNNLLEATTKSLGSQQYLEETADLRDFKQRYNLENSILSKVIVKTLTEKEQIFLVNRGSVNGVTQNMIALYKLQIIGRVLEVYDYYSKILLITDRRSKIAGYTNTTQAHGIIEGTNNSLETSLSLVSHLHALGKNDFILSSGEGLIFPEGFCLGIITHHERKPEDLYHTVVVKPMVDFEELTHCLLTSRAKISLN